MVSGGTVSSDLSALKSTAQNYTSEISGLSGVWKGLSHDNLVTKAEEFISEYSSTIDSEMSAFASACDLYKEYEQTKQSLNSAKSSYDSAVSSKDSSSISQYGNQVSTYQNKLTELKNQIESLLSTAKSTTLESASTTGTSTSATSALGTPTFGSFTEHSFKASNGLTIKYYLYVPNYNNQQVSGLPIMLYMHGGGNSNSYSNLLARGLSKSLKEQTINPSGICVIPFIQNFSDKKTIPALKEMMDNVVSETKADPNRISISGHSNGAITTYKMINAYPNYFSAAIPISGFSQVTDAFKYTKVWAFNGEYDHGQWTSNSGAQNAVKQINAIGGNAYFYSYKGYGHSYVQDFTYQRKFESPDGEEEEPLEWAFRQKKDQNTKA